MIQLFATVMVMTLATSSAGQEDAAPAVAQIGATNPHTSEEDVEAGASAFRTSCALCHGTDAKGDRGPDLTRGVFRSGNSDNALFGIVRQGVPRTDMPGTYRPDTEIWQIVAYLRVLGEGSEPVEVPGDPARGKRIFLSRGACPDCHRVGGQGGRLGPDLSDVGWIRSPQHLETSLLEPGKVLHPRYRTVVVVTKEAVEYRGVLRNEDTYSIQFLDEMENLRSFDKSELERIDKPEESLMPSFGGFFRGRDLDHLVAYLYSLKEK